LAVLALAWKNFLKVADHIYLVTEYPFPKDWTTSQNPPYNYWLL